MATFTDMTAGGVDWQSAAADGPINQLLAALHERAVIADYTPLSPAAITAGHDIQHYLFFNRLQNDVARMFDEPGAGTSWGAADHRATFAGSDNGGAAIYNLNALDASLHFSLADALGACGLGGTQFRRAVAWDPSADDWTDPGDAMWATPNVVQAGDILGPWIIHDLQLVLDQYRWTYMGADNADDGLTYTTSTVDKRYSSAGDVDCATARTNELAGWAAAGYVNEAEPSHFYMAVGTGVTDGFSFTFTDTRKRFSQTLTLPTTPLTHAAELYWMPRTASGAVSFEDIDVLGLSDTELWLAESFGAGVTASRTSALAGNIATPPIDDATPAIACGALDSRGVEVYEVVWLMKWSGFAWSL